LGDKAHKTGEKSMKKPSIYQFAQVPDDDFLSKHRRPNHADLGLVPKFGAGARDTFDALTPRFADFPHAPAAHLHLRSFNSGWR
jgi:hypothetical protein